MNGIKNFDYLVRQQRIQEKSVYYAHKIISAVDIDLLFDYKEEIIEYLKIVQSFIQTAIRYFLSANEIQILEFTDVYAKNQKCHKVNQVYK